MTDMIEKMARVIDSGGWKPFPEPDSEYHRLEIQTLEIRQKQSLEKARAALLAAREPTFDPDTVSYSKGMTRLDWWQAMIDTALKTEDKADG